MRIVLDTNVFVPEGVILKKDPSMLSLQYRFNGGYD